jgi:hypothetical protein
VGDRRGAHIHAAASASVERISLRSMRRERAPLGPI